MSKNYIPENLYKILTVKFVKNLLETINVQAGTKRASILEDLIVRLEELVKSYQKDIRSDEASGLALPLLAKTIGGDLPWGWYHGIISTFKEIK